MFFFAIGIFRQKFWLDLWEKTQEIMDHSLFFRAIDAIFTFVQRLFSSSITAKLFTGHINEEAYNASLAVRIIRKPLNLLANIQGTWFKTAYDNSGWAKLMINLGILAQGSMVVQALFKYLGIPLAKPQKLTWFPLALLFLAAIAVGAAVFVLPVQYVAIGVVGIVGALAIFSYPELGIIAVAASTPFLATMAVAALLGFVALCFCFKLMTDLRYAPHIDATGIVVVVFVGINLFYGFTSLHPSSSIRIAMLTSLLMLSYLLTTALINTKRLLNATVLTFCTAAAFTGLVGLYQYISGHVGVAAWRDADLFGDLNRVYSTFANPNVFGAYLLMAIPICLVMIHVSETVLQKLYFASISLLLILNLGLTYSRGCYLALIAGFIVYILFMERRLITLLTAGIVALPFVVPVTMLERFLSIANLEDSSTAYRIFIWRATIRMLNDFWISGLGQGIEAYNVIYPYYMFSNVSAPHSHNLFLQVFIELGIFGLIVFLLMLLAFFRAILGLFYKSNDKKTKSLLAAFFAATIAFLIQGIFDHVFYNYRVMLTFFIFMGIGSAIVNIRLKEDLR